MKEFRMANSVELLSRPVNFAVVQLAERKFPGVVVQGDTLYGAGPAAWRDGSTAKRWRVGRFGRRN
jgi:hypothetical protein